MTRDDVQGLRVGDCILGFAGDWNDEHRVIEAWAPRVTKDGKLQRHVRVEYGSTWLRGFVTEGGSEIRTVRC